MCFMPVEFCAGTCVALSGGHIAAVGDGLMSLVKMSPRGVLSKVVGVVIRRKWYFVHCCSTSNFPCGPYTNLKEEGNDSLVR